MTCWSTTINKTFRDIYSFLVKILFEPQHDKTNKVSVHPAKVKINISLHPPSLIRVFAVCLKKPWVLSYPLSAQRRPWSDWADAQADLSLCWAHTHFIGFVMSWLIFVIFILSGSSKKSNVSFYHSLTSVHSDRQCLVKYSASVSSYSKIGFIDIEVPLTKSPFRVMQNQHRCKC